MKKVLLWIVGILAVVGLASAQGPVPSTQPSTKIEVPAVVETTTQATTKQITTTTPTPIKIPNPTTSTDYAPNGTYKNVDGNTVPSPYQAPSAPSGASAQCRDGSYSFSQHRSGTCSHHGGVAEWL